MEKKICHHQKLFLLKKTLKVALEYLFNVSILFNSVSYLKINFILKIDQKCGLFLKQSRGNFENLEKICQKHLATLYIYFSDKPSNY